VVEGQEYTNNWIKAAQREQQDGLALAQRAAVAALHYATAKGKLGGDVGVAGESAGGVGVHPTQLAHLHMAQFVAAQLRALGI
jgi:hypothetical protein